MNPLERLLDSYRSAAISERDKGTAPAVANITASWLPLNTRLWVSRCLSLLTPIRAPTKFSASEPSAPRGKKALIRGI